ncbi:hypothetical protein BGZ76_002097 [Entomortierella beljakovae]|nr:hypothetical protein BGZ76_002097 [Entomortierella beljakovae]
MDGVDPLWDSPENTDPQGDSIESTDAQENSIESTDSYSKVEIDEMKDVDMEIEAGYTLESVQELTIASLKVGFPWNQGGPTYQKKLDTTELKSIFAIMPKLRMIRYKGDSFPLDEEAYTYLKNLKSRQLSVFHDTQ